MPHHAHNKGQRSTHCKCGLPRSPENTNSQGYCKSCCNAAQARFRQRHPACERGRHYQRKYGVSQEQVEAQAQKQGNRCAICKVVFDWLTRETTPSVDHAHDETNKFRGILCHLCNTGLGLFRDKPELLQSAMNYLKETQ